MVVTDQEPLQDAKHRDCGGGGGGLQPHRRPRHPSRQSKQQDH